MKKTIIQLILTIIVALFLALPVSAQPSPFENIKKTYASITTLEAKFTQKIRIESLGKDREMAGDFFYKRQKGFLWSYRTPKVKTFLYDGKFIWQTEADKPFVQKDQIKKLRSGGGAFLDLIEDIAKIDEIFTLKQHSKDGDMDMMELKPVREGTVTLAKIWIDRQNIVRKIELHEFTGNINRIDFSGIRVNQPISDGKFVFRMPPGKEIVER